MVDATVTIITPNNTSADTMVNNANIMLFIFNLNSKLLFRASEHKLQYETFSRKILNKEK